MIVRWFRETHHATVLENWGVLWMWHSLALFVACLLTNILYWRGVENRWYYFYLWTAGFGTWAAVFWALRRRMGPVTFVERQIAHVWAASMACIIALFPLESYLGLGAIETLPRDRADFRHGVCRQGRHLVRGLLYSGSGSLSDGVADGRLSYVRTLDLRFCIGRLFLLSGTQVLPTTQWQRTKRRRRID